MFSFCKYTSFGDFAEQSRLYFAVTTYSHFAELGFALVPIIILNVVTFDCVHEPRRSC